MKPTGTRFVSEEERLLKIAAAEEDAKRRADEIAARVRAANAANE